MGYTIGSLPARASSASNPITVSVTPLVGETVMVVMLKVNGGTDRAGGALTWVDPLSGATRTLIQANITQKAAASPEAGAEAWYLTRPTPGTGTLTIPNTGALTIFYQIGFAKAKAGGHSAFIAGWGSNGTSTNPTCGTGQLGESPGIAFAQVAGGHTDITLISAQTGTIIHEVDDGAHGGAAQYLLTSVSGGQVMSWTHGTSDDWGAVAVAFGEEPPIIMGNYFGVTVGEGMSSNGRVR